MPIDGNPFTSRNAWKMVMAFGFIMFSTLSAGFVCIRLYQDDVAKYNLALAAQNLSTSQLDEKPGQQDSETSSQGTNPLPVPRRALRNAHAIFMTISFIMMLGAGIAFTAVRINKYKNCGTPDSMC
jgi:hypothetical protein